MRSIRVVLEKPGMTLDKSMILVGGPDWPTSVACGIMRLPLLPMLVDRWPLRWRPILQGLPRLPRLLALLLSLSVREAPRGHRPPVRSLHHGREIHLRVARAVAASGCRSTAGIVGHANSPAETVAGLSLLRSGYPSEVRFGLSNPICTHTCMHLTTY